MTETRLGILASVRRIGSELGQVGYVACLLREVTERLTLDIASHLQMRAAMIAAVMPSTHFQRMLTSLSYFFSSVVIKISDFNAL